MMETRYGMMGISGPWRESGKLLRPREKLKNTMVPWHFMELERGTAGHRILWKLHGRLDDDSALKLESMVLNSDYRGENILLDLRELDDVSLMGRKSIDRVVRGARSMGASVEIIPPDSRSDALFSILPYRKP